MTDNPNYSESKSDLEYLIANLAMNMPQGADITFSLDKPEMLIYGVDFYIGGFGYRSEGLSPKEFFEHKYTIKTFRFYRD